MRYHMKYWKAIQNFSGCRIAFSNFVSMLFVWQNLSVSILGRRHTSQRVPLELRLSILYTVSTGMVLFLGLIAPTNSLSLCDILFSVDCTHFPWDIDYTLNVYLEMKSYANKWEAYVALEYTLRLDQVPWFSEPRCEWDNNVKINFRSIQCENMTLLIWLRVGASGRILWIC